ncbi:MAG: carbohydrate ABC transporter substrate-binding protein [Rubrivivax sp.]|nr:carbohydrate ABC transporter substrate-binding protein [Rubrivivax sp.]
MLKRRQALAIGAATLAAPWVQAQAPRALRFAWWGGSARHAATLKAIALFEQRNPGLKVKAEYMGFNGYLERLTTQVAGGSEPDVMQINWAWLAMFSKRGTGVTDLDAYRSLLALDQFSASDLAMGRVAGKLNALTASYTARVLLWNQTTFARAGLALPTTWDELFAAGPVFRNRLGERHYPLDGELYDMMLLSQAYVHQKHGTPYVDPTPGRPARVAMNAEAAREWVAVYQRLVDSHTATSLPLRASLGGAEKPTEQQQDWVTGQWAGNYTWDSVIGLRSSTLQTGQQLALGAFPMLPGARNTGMFGRPTLMLAVGRNCRQPETAARFINFLLTDVQAARLLGRTRGAPAARGPLAAVLEAGQLPPLELRAHEWLQQLKSEGRIDLPAPLFEHARLHKFMREVFETVAYGKTSAPAAEARLIQEGNALLKRIQ